MKAFRAIWICLVVLTANVTFVPICFAANAVQARSAINEAELNLSFAFATVKEADQAGADIEVLLAQLAVAGDLISEAYLALGDEDYEVVLSLALECNNAVAGIPNEAELLIVKAKRIETDILIITAFWSSIGLILLLFLSIIGWRILKSRFLERVLEMKPEMERTL